MIMMWSGSVPLHYYHYHLLSLWHWTLGIGGVNDNGAIPYPPTPMQWCLSEGRYTASTPLHILYTMTTVTGFVWCDRCFSTTVLALVCWWVENKNPCFCIGTEKPVLWYTFYVSCVFHCHCRPLIGRSREEAMEIWVWVVPGFCLRTEEWLRYHNDNNSLSFPWNDAIRIEMQQSTHVNWQWRMHANQIMFVLQGLVG